MYDRSLRRNEHIFSNLMTSILTHIFNEKTLKHIVDIVHIANAKVRKNSSWIICNVRSGRKDELPFYFQMISSSRIPGFFYLLINIGSRLCYKHCFYNINGSNVCD